MPVTFRDRARCDLHSSSAPSIPGIPPFHAALPGSSAGARSPGSSRTHAEALPSHSATSLAHPYPFLSCARRTPDSVHIVLGNMRQIEIDDIGQPIDIKAASGDIGRYEHTRPAGLEVGQRTGSRVLRLVAVYSDGLEAVLHKLSA